ncbi:MAG: hypothetical protein CMM47_02045 [Rhodospirillaceae bacterium]|nr:hypothetical protein [Rhodospirillaceae bacterium]
MPSFIFTARDNAGQPQTGVIEAASATMVQAQLRERGWIVVRINQQAEITVVSPPRNWVTNLLGPRSVDIELSLRQLAVMLRGGISLLSAMQTIATQSDSKTIRSTYGELVDQVQQGRSFSDSLETQPGFPRFLIRLVRVGERTGIQETVLVRAADMIRTRRDTVREIATALTYPIIVLIAAGSATAYMITSLIPKLSRILQSLGKPLPPITESLVKISSFFHAWGTSILAILGAAIVLFIVSYMSSGGRLFIDRWSLRLPLIGKIFRLSGTLAFSQTLGGLTQSGVTVLDSLVTVQQMHSNMYFSQIVQRSRDAIIRGNNLADTLRDRHAYMPLLATMAAVGEESGNLDDVMEQVSEFHQSQLSSMIKTLSAWITPAIIVVVGSIVGYVYIAFFLGMFAVAG